MRLTTLARVAVIALVTTVGTVSTSAAQSATLDGVTAVTEATSESVAVSAQFATLGGVKAVPMASSELDAVKGLHVHFFDANGGFHIAGTTPANPGVGIDNWYVNDAGELVAPSYHGLCVAGPIFISGTPLQCP